MRAGIALDPLRAFGITHHQSDHNADYGNLFLLAWAANLEGRVTAFRPPPLLDMTGHFLAMNRVDIDTRAADEGRRKHAAQGFDGEVVVGSDLRRL